MRTIAATMKMTTNNSVVGSGGVTGTGARVAIGVVIFVEDFDSNNHRPRMTMPKRMPPAMANTMAPTISNPSRRRAVSLARTRIRRSMTIIYIIFAVLFFIYLCTTPGISSAATDLCGKIIDAIRRWSQCD